MRLLGERQKRCRKKAPLKRELAAVGCLRDYLVKSETKEKDFSENPSTACGGPPFLFKGGRKGSL